MEPFSGLDDAALGRSLAQVADRTDDIADLFLERYEEVEVGTEEEDPGLLTRREQGLAVRLLRDGLTWLSAQDGISGALLERALREVARALPPAAYSPPTKLEAPYREPIDAAEVQSFPALLERSIRSRHVAFPFALKVRRHRRWVRVIGPRLVTDTASESFYSLVVRLPWGRYGRLVLALDERTAEETADALIEHVRAHDAAPGSLSGAAGKPIVLGAAATAVLLHEAVAHALEADTLVLGGRPEAACGYALGGAELNVLDDPGGAPDAIARSFDDEGVPVSRRWLLQNGEVREPLADQFFAGMSDRLLPGAARRAGRHSIPGPRSTHLELAPGPTPEGELLAQAEGGLFLAEVESGRLDPVTGELQVVFPFGRRIRRGEPADRVGCCRISAQLSSVLSAVRSVGSDARFAGAGWCAKSGQRLPVWATSPAVLLDGVTVEA